MYLIGTTVKNLIAVNAIAGASQLEPLSLVSKAHHSYMRDDKSELVSYIFTGKSKRPKGDEEFLSLKSIFQSIIYDSMFFKSIVSTHIHMGFPIVTNERCELWYLPYSCG